VDGNDAIAVDALAGRLVEEIRAGDGPAFIHAKTYRHFGHTLADKGLYRPVEEVEAHKAQDPIARCHAHLIGNGVAVSDLDSIAGEAEAEMAAALDAARDAPWPPLARTAADVQDVGAP
jgi:pyruvate dehydrogenase E1 component alpha subunit